MNQKKEEEAFLANMTNPEEEYERIISRAQQIRMEPYSLYQYTQDLATKLRVGANELPIIPRHVIDERLAQYPSHQEAAAQFLDFQERCHECFHPKQFYNLSFELPADARDHPNLASENREIQQETREKHMIQKERSAQRAALRKYSRIGKASFRSH